MEIKKYPSSVLRVKSAALPEIGDSERRILADMIATMRANSGIGLAAPQVGITKRLAVIDASEGILKMANPKIISRKGGSVLEEGCLSVPEKNVSIRRPDEITVIYTDENSKPCTQTFKGLTARIIQHEIDHLNGKLIVDYLPWYKKCFCKIS